MKSGTVAVVGRPNVGKSTLINALTGAKVSIVSRRRQTTRGVVRAECKTNNARIALLDSPGWQMRGGGGFARAINGGARWAAESADAILFVITPRWTAEDEDFLSRLPPHIPAAVVVNKIDLVRDKRTLLPFADALRKRRDFAAVIPASAARKKGMQELLGEIATMLPESESLSDSNSDSDSESDFDSESKSGSDSESKSDSSDHRADNVDESFSEDRCFLCGELLREKLFRALGGELPYRVGVAAKRGSKKRNVLHIRADIYAERDSQKAIILGRRGAMLQKLAAAARKDMEKLCGKKIFLETHVRVRPEWRRDPKLLADMRIGAPKPFGESSPICENPDQTD